MFDAFDPAMGEGVFIDIDELGVCGEWYLIYLVIYLE